MDRRNFKSKGGLLHKNLIGSQASSKSTSSSILSYHDVPLSKSRTLNQGTLARENSSSSVEVLTQRSLSSSNNQISTSNRESTIGETLIRKSQLPSDKRTPRKRKLSNVIVSENEVSKKRKNESENIQGAYELNNRKNTSVKQSNITQKSCNVESITKCKFVQFLLESGITLCTDGPHKLNKDLIIVQEKMKTLLRSGCYQKAEIINLMEKYIENEKNLENALNDMEIPINSKVSNVLHSSSLIKVLLQVSELYPEVYNSLVCKLNECLLLADSIEAAPWIRLLLQQFRFLDVVTCSDALTANLEQLLETCPPWFQNEIIFFLPDIVTDKQHQSVAEILNKLLEENSELTNPILDCMSHLNLGTEYLDEYKNKVLNLLKTSLHMNDISAIVKFVLEDCKNLEIYKKTLTILRTTDIQPLTGENLEDCYKNQSNIIDTLKINMLFSKDVVNATIGVVKDIIKDPKPLDIILLLLVFTTTEAKRKNVETLFKQHIRSGFYRQSLLALLYNDYKQIVNELQPAALQLSTDLLKTDERVYVDFAIDWLRLQFLCHKETVFEQREILEKIIFLMGHNEQTVKNALKFLCKMAMKEEERKCIAFHCNHLRILLEKMDNLGLEEVGALNDLLYNLCTNSSSASGALRDDLFILLRKQLSNFKPLTKCKGVLGAVMAIKHLMGKSETSAEACNLFKTVLTNVKNCPRSQALFYDQLARIIAETDIVSLEFIESLMSYIQEEFVNTYMTDKESYKGSLVPRFGLNDADGESENCLLNFENEKCGAIIPISFRLLRICCLKLSKNGTLDAIDSLLGTTVLMPENLDIAEHSVLDLVICCINWFREVISGFVKETDSLLRKQVLQRLDNLIYLQSQLNTLLSLCDLKYQPHPCFFHNFPIPPFIRIEKKIGKKGKTGKVRKKGKKESADQSVNFNETESWELCSRICSKNPMYFRKLEASVAHLFEVNLDYHKSESTTHTISHQQVCFLIKEILGLFEHECNEILITDLIHLLPIICSKLQDIAEILRQENRSQYREAMRLLLCLLTKIFSWKGFESVTYNSLLREGLRTLAAQTNESNVELRSCMMLVAESYKYFESLSDIATQISLATALINTCQSIMKHSESYTEQHKEKHAKIAFGFLCLEWPEDKNFTPQYKTAVIGLLNSWVDNELMPLGTVTKVLEWLPDEASKLETSQDCLITMPSIRKNNFHSLYKKLLEGLIKGIKISLPLAKTDPERIELWHQIASNVQKFVLISKALRIKGNILIFLKYMPILLKLLLSHGMPILEHNLKYQPEDVTGIVKMIQGGTRYLHTICCDSAEKKDITLTKYVPAAKSVLERLLYSVKGMLVLNNSPSAFWMGNLVNKNLDGHEILSQSARSEESSLPSINTLTDDIGNESSSDILDSDLNDATTEED